MSDKSRKSEFNEVPEIEIPEAEQHPVPGGVDFGQLVKYWGLISSIIAAVNAGSGSFIVRVLGKRLRITVEPA